MSPDKFLLICFLGMIFGIPLIQCIMSAGNEKTKLKEFYTTLDRITGLTENDDLSSMEVTTRWLGYTYEVILTSKTDGTRLKYEVTSNDYIRTGRVQTDTAFYYEENQSLRRLHNIIKKKFPNEIHLVQSKCRKCEKENREYNKRIPYQPDFY